VTPGAYGVFDVGFEARCDGVVVVSVVGRGRALLLVVQRGHVTLLIRCGRGNACGGWELRGRGCWGVSGCGL
jgi:hypothetical protein